MARITFRQKQILQAILEYTEEHKYPPAIRELCEIVGLKSPGSLHRHLKLLRLAGIITWEEERPRTIKVIREA